MRQGHFPVELSLPLKLFWTAWWQFCTLLSLPFKRKSCFAFKFFSPPSLSPSLVLLALCVTLLLVMPPGRESPSCFHMNGMGLLMLGILANTFFARAIWIFFRKVGVKRSVFRRGKMQPPRLAQGKFLIEAQEGLIPKISRKQFTLSGSITGSRPVKKSMSNEMIFSELAMLSSV